MLPRHLLIFSFVHCGIFLGNLRFTGKSLPVSIILAPLWVGISGRLVAQKRLGVNRYNSEQKAMNPDLAAKGVVLPLIWSQPGKEQQWQPTKGTWGQHLEQTGTKYAQEMFRIQKSYVRWAPRKAVEIWLGDEILAQEINLMNLVRKSEMGMKIKQTYQPPLQRPQSQGMWLHPNSGWDRNGSEEG